ncbi:nodulation protein NfeD [Geomonas sp.]|uniref:NfeD family protein n=1 Tax=Geomonas sp. TaxID=2651584 RepID=UPI002B483BE2|nr:nodulation protein NfeD [Geomonas sp.]HJV33492.1 nodulation protein NfeD [Geomonas sp.]
MVRLSLLILILVLPLTLHAAPTQVAVLSVRGPINPATADYLQRNIEAAGARGDRMVLVEMDTPGGLDTAMRQTVQALFASAVPVVVYVTPSGARAASAGAVIALAADLCAMAPGTNIGAAHPVSLGQQPDKVMAEKVLNDAEAYLEGIAVKRGRNADLARQMVRQSISLRADKAVAEGVVDLLADDRQALLAKLEGRHLVRGGKETVLHLSGARLISYPMGSRDRILNAISNPDLAYLLMLAGIFGIFFELANPGVILPGVIGGISLILAFFAFQTLPVNYAGALLILLAIILFIAEVKIVSHGILAVGGCVAMVLGSLLLFPSKEPYLRLSWWMIGGTVLATLVFFLVVVAKVIEAHRQKPLTGVEAMLGAVGTAETDITPEGKVLLHGETWQARSSEPIGKGEKVEVTGVEGLCVSVRKQGVKPGPVKG